MKNSPKSKVLPTKELQDSIEEVARSYDNLPYHSVAFAQTSPIRLHTIGTLFGQSPPDIATARVLEIGCASGGNIIPWALAHPKAQVVGIDISTAQVEQGQRTITQLGLKNIRIEPRSATDIPSDFGMFDYVICHGVYSWVPAEVQEAIFSICGQHLSKKGIAYISYNTYPGWKSRELVRDAMRMRAPKGGADPLQQLAYARGMVDFLAETAPKEGLMQSVMTEFKTTIQTASTSYLAHEFLEIHNSPCYFKDFAERAAKHQLSYLAEAEPHSMFLSNYGEHVANLLIKECTRGQLEVEQYLDFITNRPFRQTLLLHTPLAAQTNYTITNQTMLTLHLCGTFTPVTANGADSNATSNTFTNLRGGSITAPTSWQNDSLLALNNAYPSTISVPEFLALNAPIDPSAVLSFLHLLVITNAVSYNTSAKHCISASHYAPNALPVAYAPAVALAKLWLSDLNSTNNAQTDVLAVVNAWHEHSGLAQPAALALALADGTQTCEEIQRQTGVDMIDLYRLGLISA